MRYLDPCKYGYIMVCFLPLCILRLYLYLDICICNFHFPSKTFFATWAFVFWFTLSRSINQWQVAFQLRSSLLCLPLKFTSCPKVPDRAHDTFLRFRHNVVRFCCKTGPFSISLELSLFSNLKIMKTWDSIYLVLFFYRSQQGFQSPGNVHR